MLESERLIGRKAILNIMRQMYGHDSWQGALNFIKQHNLPIRRTPAGKPMFYKHELIKYEAKFQDILQQE